jgi:HD superfamily phosphohydrolase
MHDIGHGPFSHLFDYQVIREIDGKKWSHEVASLPLIDAVYDYVLSSKKDQREIEWLNKTRNRVKALIIGKITESQYSELSSGHCVYLG